jgi:hypothetical protein
VRSDLAGLCAVPSDESANVAEGASEAASAGEVLTFKSKPVLKDVLAAVERCAVPRSDTAPEQG